MSSCYRNFLEFRGVENFLTRIIKNLYLFSSIVLQRIKEVENDTLNTFNIFDFLQHHIVRRLEMLVETQNFIKLWLEGGVVF